MPTRIRGEHIFSRFTDVYVLTRRTYTGARTATGKALQSMMRTFAGLTTEMVNRIDTRVLNVARDNQTERFITNAVDAAARGDERPPYFFVLPEFGSARIRHYVNRRRRVAHSGNCVRQKMPSEGRTSNCTRDETRARM